MIQYAHAYLIFDMDDDVIQHMIDKGLDLVGSMEGVVLNEKIINKFLKFYPDPTLLIKLLLKKCGFSSLKHLVETYDMDVTQIIRSTSEL
jgi:hypothetical protein